MSVTGNVRVQRSVIEREFKAAAAAKTHHDLAVELSKVSQSEAPFTTRAALRGLMQAERQWMQRRILLQCPLSKTRTTVERALLPWPYQLATTPPGSGQHIHHQPSSASCKR